MTVVAISAAYGALGSRIGPALAERLGAPFLDRALDLRVAGALDVSPDEAAEHWDPPARPFIERLLSSFLGVDTGAPVGPPPPTTSPSDFRRATEAAVIEQADTGAGVILGRAAVAVLRDRPNVLRVRLGGLAERRLAQARRIAGAEREPSAAAMRRLDRYHADYLRTYYDVDIDDLALYHLAIDATALEVTTCVALIASAAASLG